jgi:hypothetical protein
MPSTASNNPELNKKFDDLTSQIDDLYKNSIGDNANKIKEKLEEKYNQFNDSTKPKSEEEVREFLSLVEDIFYERAKALIYKKNILRQENEIYQVQLKPEAASLTQYVGQAPFLDSALSIEQIQQYNEPIVHIKNPSSEYRSKLMMAGVKTQDLIEMNIARLACAIEKGEDLPPEKKEKLANLRSGNEKYSEIAEKIATKATIKTASILHSIFDAAGRGIYSKGQAVDHSYNKEYSAKKEKIISELSEKIDLGDSKYAALLSRVKSQFSQSSEALDILALSQIEEEIKKSVEEIEKDHKVRVEKAEKDLKEAHEKMLTDLQNTVDSSDSLIPMRLLSIGLMFTPFGALGPISILSEYIGTAIDIFGPIFEAGKSIGEGLGDAVTSKHFGVLGELMDVMEVDLAIETIIDETPIIKDVTEVLNAITDSSTAQYLFAEISPLQNSVLLYLGVAGVVSLGRAPEEIAHFSKKSADKKKHDKILENLPKTFESDLGKVGEESIRKTITEIYQKRKSKFQELEALNFMADNFVKIDSNPKIAEVLQKISPEIYQLFSDKKFEENGSFSKDKMIRFIASNEDGAKKSEEVGAYMQQAAKNFKIFASIGTSFSSFSTISDIDKAITQFDELSKSENSKELQEKVKKIDAELQKRFAKFESDRLGIIASIDDKNLAQVEAKIKENMVKSELQNIGDIQTPKKLVIPTAVREMNGNEIFPPKPPYDRDFTTSNKPLIVPIR